MLQGGAGGYEGQGVEEKRGASKKGKVGLRNKRQERRWSQASLRSPHESEKAKGRANQTTESAGEEWKNRK